MMKIRYKPDALYPAYKTVRLENIGEDMTNQKRRIEDKLPTEPLQWEDGSQASVDKQILAIAEKWASRTEGDTFTFKRGYFLDCVRAIQEQAKPADGVDWRPYHSALSQCAELLDNMKDGDSILDVPECLADYLASQSQVAQPKIKTWQDRTGNHNIRPGSVKHMLAEIAELRAALAGQSQASKVQAVPVAEHSPTAVHILSLTYDKVTNSAKLRCPVCGNEELHTLDFQGHDKYMTCNGGKFFFTPRHYADEVAAQEVTQQAAPTVVWTAEEIANACVKAGLGILECNSLIVTLKSIPAVTQQAAKAETAEQAEDGQQANVLPPFAAPASQHDAQYAAVWTPVTGSGQVKKGDKLRFTIGDKSYSERAKLILHAGTDKEEVIYDKGRNFYFITSMVVSGKSNHKGVQMLDSGFREGRNTQPESSDLAPTTSTVSAPDEQDDENDDTCRFCEGQGEVQGQGSAQDIEPPTKKCSECNGSGKASYYRAAAQAATDKD